MKRRVWPLWIALLLAVVAGTAWIAFPTFYIMPFRPQSARAMQWALLARTWAPVVTLTAAIVATLLAAWTIARSRRWWARALAVLVLVPVVGGAWFARQNHFEWMFHPLPSPAYARARAVRFVGDDDMVIAIDLNGDAVAYPVRQMAYHHVVNDVVGGEPVVSTY
jgi:uncharacterized protein DUF3179